MQVKAFHSVKGEIFFPPFFNIFILTSYSKCFLLRYAVFSSFYSTAVSVLFDRETLKTLHTHSRPIIRNHVISNVKRLKNAIGPSGTQSRDITTRLLQVRAGGRAVARGGPAAGR